MAASNYIVKGIPSSFVFSDMKLLDDKGAGEAKLFVGSKRKEGEIDRFFAFGSGMTYRFDKQNMLEYLLQVKMEYAYQNMNRYKAANLAKWNELYDSILEMDNEQFVIDLNKFTDNSRYYVRADEDLFKKTFRKMAVPKLTDLVFEKDDESREIVLNLQVNYEFEKTDAALENEYKYAAKIVKNYISENGFEMPVTEEEVEQSRQEFLSRFAPEKLADLTDDELLGRIFYTSGDNSEALCYWLEKRKDCYTNFGSIAGGYAFMFGLFQRKETGVWTTGSSQKPQELSEEEALEMGKSMRDALVKGVEIIRSAELNSLEAYEKLDDDLRKQLGEQHYNKQWFHKYFAMVCPDKLSCYHNSEWQRHVLYGLGIKPSEKYYARSGQIAMIENYAGLSYRLFSSVVQDKFGAPKKFVRIGTSDNERSYAQEWKQRSVVGVGWRALGTLKKYTLRNRLDKLAVAAKLREEYYKNDTNTASRKAGEIIRFYNTDKNTIFVAMAGEKLIAFIDDIGAYFYDANTAMSHLKPGCWHMNFEEGELLPNKSEGKLTSCYELADEENLLFLYQRYYYGEYYGEAELQCETAVDKDEKADISLIYNTSIETKHERNRIIFGAPGTGKSYALKEDCEKLMEDDGSYERVTFHPDYSYSQFVGTYKPIMDDGNICYDFVPGPFMRVYVEALKSARTGTPKPHLLLIEEINRSKPSAVFGDVFQLLDRDDDGVSEYEIQTSEDIRRYLASALDVPIDSCKKIRIPNNMFIWATMNSADQGVFPMDTAFKRRWSFEYIGINENEDKIAGTGKIALAGSDDLISWNVLRRAVNAKMSSGDFKINEDKLMGPFFLPKHVTASDENGMIIDKNKFIKVFKSKVIMYLYEDAVRQGKHRFFDGCDSSKYSSVCEAFDKIGIGIFGADFRETFYDTQEDEM